MKKIRQGGILLPTKRARPQQSNTVLTMANLANLIYNGDVKIKYLPCIIQSFKKSMHGVHTTWTYKESEKKKN